MCLYSHNIKPFVSDKDIVVYKLLDKNGDSFRTPCQGTSVEIGAVLKANGTLPELPSDYSNNEIGEGVIHAYIRKDIVDEISNDRVFVKAIIKAGTPFFVQFDMQEVAARELYLTTEFITKNDYNEVVTNIGETHKIIYNLMREESEAVSNNGVKVGDVLLSDKKTFVTPENITKDMDIIGVVGFIRNNGKPHVISLHQEEKQWYKTIGCKTLVNKVSSYDKAVNDFNGRKYTKRLFEAVSNDISDYPALEYCVNYSTNGTKKGDWVFDSTGEVLQVVRNSYLINVTINKINEINPSIKAEKIILRSYYWASAENSQTNAWGCDTYGALCNRWNGKWNSNYVRPSLAID